LRSNVSKIHLKKPINTLHKEIRRRERERERERGKGGHTSGVSRRRGGIVTIRLTESSYTLESSLFANISARVTPTPPGRTRLPVHKHTHTQNVRKITKGEREKETKRDDRESESKFCLCDCDRDQ
jgi:hypothetical protein